MGIGLDVGMDVEEEKGLQRRKKNNVLLSRSEPVHFIRLATKR